jgi:hypothetical protein
MMRANPNVKKDPRMGKSLNKLTIINNSEFVVKYHAEFYEDTAVVHVEKEGNVQIMGFGAGGNNKKDFVKGELLDPEISSIPPKGTTDITVDESKKVKLKYYYIGLHNDYTDEQRNFTVYDEVLFDQPTPDQIKQIKEQRRIKEEEECLKNKDKNIIALPCATTYKHMCIKGGITRQCPHCKHFFCEKHFNVNNNLLGEGGHVCY